MLGHSALEQAFKGSLPVCSKTSTQAKRIQKTLDLGGKAGGL